MQEISRYESDFLGSGFEDFGKGLIIHLPHVEGTIPVLKHKNQ